MISVKDALNLIRSNQPILGTEQIIVADALGRTLSEDIISTMNTPPFSAANMDGFAISSCKPQDQLQLIGESSAGHPFEGQIKAGEAVRISTGARLPKGADRILIQENADFTQDVVTVKKAPNKDTHIRPLGSDYKVGDVLLKAGQVLSAPQLMLCLAAGLGTLKVSEKPKLALLSNGDELIPPSSELQDGKIYASNALGLKALLDSWKIDVTIFDGIRDNQDDITKTISKLSEFDLIVPIGGASIGPHDLMRSSFKAAGFEIIFDRIAMRPGKPCWMGRTDKQIVLGLPGNPASAFVCTQIFLRAVLNLEKPFFTAALTEDVEENGPRETYLRATTTLREGQIWVTPIKQQESYRHRPQAEATALIKLPPLSGPYRRGETLHILLLDDLALAR